MQIDYFNQHILLVYLKQNINLPTLELLNQTGISQLWTFQSKLQLKKKKYNIWLWLEYVIFIISTNICFGGNPAGATIARSRSSSFILWSYKFSFARFFSGIPNCNFF